MLGLMGYYQMFITAYSDLVRALTQLTIRLYSSYGQTNVKNL